MEVMTGARNGNKIYIFDGYVYMKNRKRRNVMYLHCVHKNCRAPAILKDGRFPMFTGLHNHGRDDARISVMRLRNELREESRACRTTLKETFDEVISRHHLAARYVTYANVRSLMFAARAQVLSPGSKYAERAGKTINRISGASGDVGTSNNASLCEADQEYTMGCWPKSEDGDGAIDIEDDYMESISLDSDDDVKQEYTEPESIDSEACFMRQDCTEPVSADTKYGIMRQDCTEPVFVDTKYGIVRQDCTEPVSVDTKYGIMRQDCTEPVSVDTKYGIIRQDATEPITVDSEHTILTPGYMERDLGGDERKWIGRDKNMQHINNIGYSRGVYNSPGYHQGPVIGVSCSSAPTVSVITTFPSTMTTNTVSAVSGPISTLPVLSNVMSLANQETLPMMSNITSLPNNQNIFNPIQPYFMFNQQPMAPNLFMLPPQQNIVPSPSFLVTPLTPSQAHQFTASPVVQPSKPATLRTILPKTTESPAVSMSAMPFNSAPPHSEPPSATPRSSEPSVLTSPPTVPPSTAPPPTLPPSTAPPTLPPSTAPPPTVPPSTAPPPTLPPSTAPPPTVPPSTAPPSTLVITSSLCSLHTSRWPSLRKMPSSFIPTLDQFYFEYTNLIKIDLTLSPEALKPDIKFKFKELCSAIFMKSVNPKDIIIASPIA